MMLPTPMLPTSVPVLSRYRQAVRGPEEGRIGWLTVVADAGYFF